MNIDDKIKELSMQYEILHVVDLDLWHDVPFYQQSAWLTKQLTLVYRPAFENNQRIIFKLSRGDVYDNENAVAGNLLCDFQTQLNNIDISNFFVILVTNDGKFIPSAVSWVHKNISSDPVAFTHITCDPSIHTKSLGQKAYSDFKFNSVNLMKIDLDQLTDQQQYLLTKSATFCMYPWVHLHAYPTGAAHPCCHSDQSDTIGNCRTQSLKEIWNDTPLKTIRTKMLSDIAVSTCNRCYEQEAAGFMSGRKAANKHHGHLIDRVSETQADGTFERFEMTYWDIRFSNLCNLSCRSCGHIFSSSWYQDQAKIAGAEWERNNKPLIIAGKNKTDMWEQLLPHIDYVEQIYFAGGEPLMMEEHYNILDELERRGRFDVRLRYNTNFTQTKLKDRTVFDYWKRFKSVSVGASLDGMGARAEYIRKGTEWDTIERNRALMMEVCPAVDFYVSPTLSILNAWHLPDFHRNWADKGYIKPQDLNVNILQSPLHYRIDIATSKYKDLIRAKYQDHLEWLRPRDPLSRATVGFESAINYMMATNNSEWLPKFWTRTTELDRLRNENVLEVIPELKEMQ